MATVLTKCFLAHVYSSSLSYRAAQEARDLASLFLATQISLRDEKCRRGLSLALGM